MNRLLLLFLLFAISIFSLSAKSEHDVVTLKTGNVYIGSILVENSEIVMIKTLSGSRFQFPLSDIKDIKRNTSINITSDEIQEDEEPKNNFCTFVELAGNLTKAQHAFDWSPGTQISLSLGIREVAGKPIFMGAGVGFNSVYIAENKSSTNFLPVFLHLQSNITSLRICPVVGLKAGYSFGLNDDIKGGIVTGTFAGVLYKINYRTSVCLNFFAEMQQYKGMLNEIRDQKSFRYHGNTTMFTTGLKAGFKF